MPHRLVERLVRADRHDGPEDLLAANLHLRLHVGDQRRLVERPLALAAREHRGALRDGLLDPLLDPVDLAPLDHGADVDGRVHRVADLQALDLLDEPGREVLVNLGGTRTRCTLMHALAGLVVPAERDPLRGQIQVRVAVDDDARVAAELERDALLRGRGP